MQRIARFPLTQRSDTPDGANLVVTLADGLLVLEASPDGEEGLHPGLVVDLADVPVLRRALDAVEAVVSPSPDGPFTSAARGAIRLHGVTEVATEHENHCRSAHGHCTTCGTVWPCRTAVAVVAVNLEAAQR